MNAQSPACARYNQTRRPRWAAALTVFAYTAINERPCLGRGLRRPESSYSGTKPVLAS